MRPSLSRRAIGFLVIALSLSPSSSLAVLAHDDAAGSPAVTITARASLDRDDVRIQSGEIVRFVNRDDERHRFRSTSGPDDFDTGNLEPGESAQIRLVTAGTYAFRDERQRETAAYRGRIVVGSATSDGGSTATPGAGGDGAATGGGAATVSSSATITIGDRVFQPTTVTVAVGGTVTFRNQDDREHTATSDGPGPIDSGTLASGDRYRATFPNAGRFAFLCLIHPEMRGTVEVVAAGGAAPAPVEAAPTSTPTPTPSPTPSPTPTPGTGTPGTGPTTVAATIVDFAFEPSVVEVSVGGRVAWANEGQAPHTVTAADGSFDSGTLEAGATFETTFATVGDHAFTCAIHPAMTGTVRVIGTGAGDGSVDAAAIPVPSASASPTLEAVASPDVQPQDLSAVASVEAAGPVDPGAAIGIIVSVAAVLVAMVLFGRAVRGTVRPA